MFVCVCVCLCARLCVCVVECLACRRMCEGGIASGGLRAFEEHDDASGEAGREAGSFPHIENLKNQDFVLLQFPL